MIAVCIKYHYKHASKGRLHRTKAKEREWQREWSGRSLLPPKVLFTKWRNKTSKRKLHNITSFLFLMMQSQNRRGGVNASQVWFSIDPNWTGPLFSFVISFFFSFITWLSRTSITGLKVFLLLFYFYNSFRIHIAVVLHNALNELLVPWLVTKGCQFGYFIWRDFTSPTLTNCFFLFFRVFKVVS